MPTSIPYDPSLVLGNIVDLERIKFLEDIAAAQNPQDLAQDSLNNIIISTRNLESIMAEMINMDVPEDDLENLQSEIDKLKVEATKAAVELGSATVAAISQVREIKAARGQVKVHASLSSPLDWNTSVIKPLPLANDSMSFDVQYFRNEVNEQGQSTTAKTIAKFAHDNSQGASERTTSKDISDSVHTTVSNQTSNHSIEGVIVITANCTHRQAQIIDPFVINASKAISDWNDMFPDDTISTAADDIFNYALEPTSKNKMQLLSGATYGSSFVGMVFIKQLEKIDTTQESEALAETMRDSFTSILATREQAGEYGVGKEFAEAAKSIASSSELSNHCSLVTRGIIPNIASQTMKTTVANLKPDPQEIMAQLGAIQGASNAVANESMEAMATKAKQGQQFIRLNSEYLTNTVSAIGSYDNENNQVIDMNSLMTAFTDYVQKAISGEGVGTPINFFLRDVNKANIAKAYISKYYPNGATTQALALRGRTGQAPA
mmetsp:Transcript_3980/g.5733  ORF Transcript_3980/g.5733 Transcript_3980/m.5733 type:complete len:492 (+) Transcript_3980:72-1547(+)|eukprot:CAMPEP_0194211328 /NCGR_PEP_ID=MMETSP0156-20130528/10048_1 /TAXON_ID=33649 /ORGANISM="Thalassionema nitzschioides, Strain L26-B" /LENGTH=491 /DNA_ID=CAMNT_0038938843 /DNA_START=49 /DNA_END=1524 /DNA_ORIENTATION=+